MKSTLWKKHRNSNNMKLSSLLKKEDIFIGCPQSSPDEVMDKFRFLENISRIILGRGGFTHEDVEKAVEAILEREKSMTTGIGENVAIPHVSLPFIKDAIGAMCITRDGIDFDSIDRRPVHVVILLFVPKNQFQQHIRTLAGIARLVNEESFRKMIITQNSADDVWEKIVEKENLDEKTSPENDFSA